MGFLFASVVFMALSVFLVYRITEHFGLAIDPRALALCAVMALVVNFSAILLSAYMTFNHLMLLIGMVLFSAALVTGVNEFLLRRAFSRIVLAGTEKAEAERAAEGEIFFAETESESEAPEEPGPVQEILPEPVMESEPVQEAISEPTMEPEPVREVTPEPVKEPAPVQEPIPEPVMEPTSMREVIPKPVAKPEPVQEVIPELVAEPEPVQEVIPELVAEPAPSPEVTPEPVKEPEPVQEVTPEPVWEPEPVQEVTPEPVWEPEPVQEVIPEPVKEPEPVQEVTPEPVMEPEPVQEVTPEPVKESEPVQEVSPEPVWEPELVQEVVPEPVAETIELPDTLVSLDDYLDYAYAEKSANRYAQAAAAYRKAIDLFSDDPYAPFLVIELGNLHKETGAFVEAAETYRRALDIPVIQGQSGIADEFRKNIAYLDAVAHIMARHHASGIPFGNIPPDWLAEIEETFANGTAN